MRPSIARRLPIRCDTFAEACAVLSRLNRGLVALRVIHDDECRMPVTGACTCSPSYEVVPCSARTLTAALEAQRQWFEDARRGLS